MKQTVATFQEAKQNQKKLTMLTAYDYSTAKLFDEAGIDSLLVGDSLGMVMLGYEDTLSVTMEDMLHHCKAVARGAKQAMVICDLPFLSYQTSVYDAVKNAGRLLQEGRAQAVKLEGGADMCPQIRAIVQASIPVMGHLGLTPQSVHAFGGFRVQGKTEDAAQKLIDDARRVERPGRLPWCWNASRRSWPSASHRWYPSLRLGLAPAPAATGRCWYIRICWGCTAILPPNL